MTSWMKQRDMLVEQTLAFVKGVAAAQPISIPPTLAQPLPAAAAVGADDLPPAVQAALMTATLAAQAEAVAPRVSETSDPIFVAPVLQRAPLASMVMPEQSERDLIEQRVARFRASQRALHARRAADYETLQDRVRTTLNPR